MTKAQYQQKIQTRGLGALYRAQEYHQQSCIICFSRTLHKINVDEILYTIKIKVFERKWVEMSEPNTTPKCAKN